MPYRYLDDIAIADAAFEAWGETIEKMLIAASDATVNIMVGDLNSIEAAASRRFRVEDAQLEMLLFKILQELVYFKDAEQLLLRVRNIQIERQPDLWSAIVEASGEPIDPKRHDLVTDIKAVTLHRLRTEQGPSGWNATVVIDI